MKKIKLVSIFVLLSMLTSCHVDFVNDEFFEESISLNQLLNSHELWYVDINETIGFGQTLFLQKAFTVSFLNGNVYANNNLVGIGSQGNGLGIMIGQYDAYDMILDVYHTFDGFSSFDIYQIDGNTIELYNPFNDTSYFLHGYQRNNFDYDYVFYDNIHYFLQEYQVWEKTYTSEDGALSEFDYENFLQFVPENNGLVFRSSQDDLISSIHNVFWDFTGTYNVQNIEGNMYLKKLILNYDYFSDEYFELSILSDQLIKLYHAPSGTYYEFEGVGYIQYETDDNETSYGAQMPEKLRIQRSIKKENQRTSKRL